MKEFLRREWPVIAWLVSFALIGVALLQVAQFQGDLRDSSIAACERQNVVRGAVRTQLTAEIEETQRVDYSELFPTIPHTEIDRLIRESNERAREQRAAIPDADCESLYPE